MESEYRPSSRRIMMDRICDGNLVGSMLMTALFVSIVIDALVIEAGLDDFLLVLLAIYAVAVVGCAIVSVVYVFEGFRDDGTWPDGVDGKRHGIISVHANRVREVFLKLSPHDQANARRFLVCTAICSIMFMISICVFSSTPFGHNMPGWARIVTILATPVSGTVASVFSTYVRVPKDLEPYIRNPAEEARKRIRDERVAEKSRMIGTVLSATGARRKTTESAASRP